MTDLSKYTMLDVLVATPFDKRFNLSGKLTTKTFFDKYFIPDIVFEKMNEQLENNLKKKPSSLPFFCFLEGYAGTGKTTFIHWFAQNSTLDMQFAFLDFSVAKTYTHERGDIFAGEDLFEDYFIQILSHIYDSFKDETIDLFEFLYRHSTVLTRYFQISFFDNLTNCYVPRLRDPLKPVNFSRFVQSLKYTEMLLLLMMFYNKFPYFIDIISGVNNNSKKYNELVLFFDNMDSMKLEDKGSIIPKDIAALYHDHYLHIINDFNYFDKERKINFVFCMRDSVYSVINPQQLDFFHFRHLSFATKASLAEKIFFKRRELAEKEKIDVNTIESEILCNIYEDRFYIERSYLPLFNYNLRKFSHFIINSSTGLSDSYLSRYKSLMTSEIKKQRVGARGIIYYIIINGMLKRDFISDILITTEGIASKEGSVGMLNIARILLTIIHNKTQYNLNTKNRTERLKKTNFFDVYKDFRKVYKNHINDFVSTIGALFLFYKENWCHLVTLSNLQVFNLKAMKNVEQKLKKYEKLQKNKKIRPINKIKKELSKIKIRLNSSGYIFLKDIIRHYEYHSVKAGNTSPLFVSTNIISKDKASPYTFEFEESINATMEIAFSCIRTLSSFLDESDFSFENSAFCFRIYSEDDRLDDGYDHYECCQTTRPGQLLLNRIVDTHINYIDEFRLYILNNRKLIVDYSDKLKIPINDVQKKINNLLIDILLKYTEKYYFYNDESILLLKKLQQENIKKINLDGYDGVYSIGINKDRDFMFTKMY